MANLFENNTEFDEVQRNQALVCGSGRAPAIGYDGTNVIVAELPTSAPSTTGSLYLDSRGIPRLSGHDTGANLLVDGTKYAQTSVGIQAAVDDLPATGGKIHLAAGSYSMTENGSNGYCVLVNKPVFFEGEGAGYDDGSNTTRVTQLMLAASQDCDMLQYYNSAGHIYYGEFRGIEFHGNKDNQGTANMYGLKFRDCSDIKVCDCLFREFRSNSKTHSAIYIDGTVGLGSWGFWLKDLNLEACDGWAIIVIGTTKDAYRIWVKHCHFRGLAAGIKFDDCYDSGGNGGAGWVDFCDFRNCEVRCIYGMGTTSGLTIIGNQFLEQSDSTVNAIDLAETVNRAIIVGNQIVASSGTEPKYGLVIGASVQRVMAWGNDFSAATTAAYSVSAGGNANGSILTHPSTGAFMNFVGESEAGVSKALSSWTTGNSIQGFAQIEINGTKRWVPFYDDPTS